MKLSHCIVIIIIGNHYNQRLIAKTGSLDGNGICKYERSVRCCTNYRQVDNKCTPCIGTFGNNCSGGICPAGFYGFGCLSECNCTVHVCDRHSGKCLINETDNGNSDIPWRLICLVALTSIVVSGSIYLIFSIRKHVARDNSGYYVSERQGNCDYEQALENGSYSHYVITSGDPHRSYKTGNNSQELSDTQDMMEESDYLKTFQIICRQQNEKADSCTLENPVYVEIM